MEKVNRVIKGLKNEKNTFIIYDFNKTIEFIEIDDGNNNDELDKILKGESERGVGRANSNTPSEQTSGILELLEAASKGKKRKR